MKKNKKVWIIVVSVIAVVIIAVVGLYQYGKTLMPYYNNTSKNIVLLSNKENKLNDDQIDEFYNIARGALTSVFCKTFLHNIAANKYITLQPEIFL